MRTKQPSNEPRRSAIHRGRATPGDHAELVWDGKYDAAGERTEVPTTPVSQALRTVERWGSPGLAPLGRIVHGDNLTTLRLSPELVGTAALVYIDPPYGHGTTFRASTPGAEPAIGYRDTWGRGQDSYLHRLAIRLTECRRLLAEDGALFVHCDWRANYLIRSILDELFGSACFRNEIIWRRAPNLGRQAASRQLGRVLDTILVYTRTAGCEFRGEPPTRRRYPALGSSGRPMGARWDPVCGAYYTGAPRGDYTDASVAALEAEGRITRSASGRVYIRYFMRQDEAGRWYREHPVDSLWDDEEVRPLRHCSRTELEVGYDTQKPEGLLRRIVGWASRPGDLVIDPCAGSGTTGVAAAELGRRWVLFDQSDTAIARCRERLARVAGPSVLVQRISDQRAPEPSGSLQAVVETTEGAVRVRLEGVSEGDPVRQWAVGTEDTDGAFEPGWSWRWTGRNRLAPLLSGAVGGSGTPAVRVWTASGSEYHL